MQKIFLFIGFAFLFLQCGNKVIHRETSNKKVATISSDSLHSFTTDTTKLLMKNVGEQMHKGRLESALEFCNIEALLLTKSMSDQ